MQLADARRACGLLVCATALSWLPGTRQRVAHNTQLHVSCALLLLVQLAFNDLQAVLENLLHHAPCCCTELQASLVAVPHTARLYVPPRRPTRPLPRPRSLRLLGAVGAAHGKLPSKQGQTPCTHTTGSQVPVSCVLLVLRPALLVQLALTDLQAVVENLLHHPASSCKHHSSHFKPHECITPSRTASNISSASVSVEADRYTTVDGLRTRQLISMPPDKPAALEGGAGRPGGTHQDSKLVAASERTNTSVITT